jgi:hypothetical protein
MILVFNSGEVVSPLRGAVSPVFGKAATAALERSAVQVWMQIQTLGRMV